MQTAISTTKTTMEDDAERRVERGDRAADDGVMEESTDWEVEDDTERIVERRDGAADDGVTEESTDWEVENVTVNKD